jgi:negative regulator of replication initiation
MTAPSVMMIMKITARAKCFLAVLQAKRLLDHHAHEECTMQGWMRAYKSRGCYPILNNGMNTNEIPDARTRNPFEIVPITAYKRQIPTGRTG